MKISFNTNKQLLNNINFYYKILFTRDVLELKGKVECISV